MDYKSAGVDIDKGDALVGWIQKNQKPGPFEDKMISGVGGFASIMKFDFADIKKPCLVSATDGVGTKLKLAVHLESYETIGQDLVAMCVNDLACTGARPLFFLDYYATGKLDLEQAQPFIAGVRSACDKVGAQLVGGETAEMPGVYQNRDFDCAGFAVGVVDEDQILGRHNVKEGDEVIAVSSSGFHSNGYSLLRKVFADDLSDWAPELLTPTALYTGLVNKLIVTGQLHAAAHITGGGMDNIARVLPKGLSLALPAWQFSKTATEVQKRAGLSREQMLKTFNCGVGFTVIGEAGFSAQAIELAKSEGFEAFALGTLKPGDQPVIYPGEGA